MGLNLHSIVRGAIASVAHDLPCDLYTMTGRQQRDEQGDTVPVFHSPVPVKAQWQSLKSDEIVHLEKVEFATTVRRVYLHATDDASKRPWASWRPLGRSGDMLKDDKGNFWKIVAVMEDFSHEGWVCVQATLMTTPPEMVVEEAEDVKSN